MKVYFKNSSVFYGKSYGKGWHDLPESEAKLFKGARGVIVEEVKVKVAPKRRKKK